MMTRQIREKIIHDWLRLPYRLRVRYRRLNQPFKLTYIFIHGLADTGELWQPFLDKLPADSNYIVVDLLGHGNSHVTGSRRMYSARQQARHVMATCVTSGVSGPVVLVGHSFGALVAIEFASMYRGIVKKCVLVAPPIYRDESQHGKARLQQDSLLREAYRQALKSPRVVVTGYDWYSKLGLSGFSETQLTTENFSAFRDTLLAGIISQSAASKLLSTPVETVVIYGKLDPFVVEKNLKYIEQHNPRVTLCSLAMSTHAIRGKMSQQIERNLVVK